MQAAVKFNIPWNEIFGASCYLDFRLFGCEIVLLDEQFQFQRLSAFVFCHAVWNLDFLMYKMKAQWFYLPNNTVLYLRRLKSSATSPWSPEVSQALVTRMVFRVHLKAMIRIANCYRMARKKADTDNTDFHLQNALSSIPVGQSRVWMEIKGQTNSGQVTVGEDTTLLVKAVLPGDIKYYNLVLLNMSQPPSHNCTAVSLI